MAERKAAKKIAKKSTTRATGRASTGLTAEERAALRETIAERKAAANKEDGESALLAKIAEMPPADRSIAKRLHEIVKTNAPGLAPKTWYGMPAYAKDGKVVLFFRDRQKFKERYMTLGFNEEANLDDGAMWPIAFALKELTVDIEAKIGALVKKAVS